MGWKFVPWLRLVGGVATLMILVAAFMSAATAPKANSWLPGESLALGRLGYLFATKQVPSDSDGRPHLFRLATLSKSDRSWLTTEMQAELSLAVRRIRPSYKSMLAFYFASYKGGQFLVIVVDGHTDIPVLNLCVRAPERGCQRYCPYFSDPLLRRIVASTMPACTDRASFWRQ